MAHDQTVRDILKALDTMDREVTSWEAGFLDSLLRQSYPLTGKQRHVLVRMAEQYLSPQRAAELLGQQRLFG